MQIRLEPCLNMLELDNIEVDYKDEMEITLTISSVIIMLKWISSVIKRRTAADISMTDFKLKNLL